MNLRVFFDHHVISEHPPGSTVVFRPGNGGDDVVVTHPDGTQVVHLAGSWHGGGYGIACAGAKFDPTCPSCTATGPARPAATSTTT